MGKPLVLVVGGGFAGVEAARTLLRSSACDVLLVDAVNFSLFTPMLAEVAVGDIETRHILVPHRDLLPPGGFRQGLLLAIDPERGAATVESPFRARRDTIDFDHAFLAPGGVTKFFGIDGAEEHAFTFKTIGDAVLIRNRILSLLERASVEPSPDGRRSLGRVVVVGGGYSGVELAASISDFLRRVTRRKHPELASSFGVTVVERMERVTPMLDDSLQETVRRRLRAMGVDLRLGTAVEAVTPEGVRFEGGEFLPSETVIWTAGVGPSPELGSWGLSLDDHGRIEVENTLRVRGQGNLWAGGDAARVPLPDGSSAPPTAQHAGRQGRTAARNILRALEGRAPEAYRYRARGEIVALGHRSAAGEVMGIRVTGFLAWWLWRTYYLFRLPTVLRRVRVAADWTVKLLFQEDLVMLPVRTEREARPPAASGETTPEVSAGPPPRDPAARR